MKIITQTVKIFTFFIFCFLQKISAQVANYTFSQSLGAYSALTAPTTIHASGWDDNVSAAITLPFTFKFNSTDYTTCVVSSNGFITFGTTPPTTTNYTPISSTAGYSGAISALGRDFRQGFDI